MRKKLACYICGKDEKIVDDKIVKRFCSDCLNNGNFFKYQIQKAKEQRLEELKK